MWGLIGGLCVEALALYSSIKKSKSWSWRCPIPQGLAAYVGSVILRVGAGAGLSAAAAGSGQVSGTFAAFALGIAAPLVVEKLSQNIPLTGPLTVDQPKEPVPLVIEAENSEQVSSANVDTGGGQNAR